MAILDQGLLGGYSGKLGTTVGASWKGINVVRAYQPNVANPKTPKQVEHRTNFKDWVNLASFLLPTHIKPLWDHKAKRMSGYNAFISRNMTNRSSSGYPQAHSIILSEGIMGQVTDVKAQTEDGTTIRFTWDSELLGLYGDKDDQLFAIVVNTEGELLGFAPAGTTKNTGVAVFTVQFETASVGDYVIFAFKSANGMYQSPTQRVEIVDRE